MCHVLTIFSRYFHDLFTIFSGITTLDAKDWNDANDDFQSSWKCRENSILKYHESWKYRVNNVKISYKYHQSWKYRYYAAQIMTLDTNGVSRENIVKISSVVKILFLCSANHDSRHKWLKWCKLNIVKISWKYRQVVNQTKVLFCFCFVQ